MDIKHEAAGTPIKRPLSYKVKTDGFAKAGLLKTECITRESPDGNRLHQVILFYYGEAGDEPDELPTSIKLASYKRSQYSRGWYFDRAVQQWAGGYEDASLLRDILEDKFPSSGRYQQLSGDAAADALAQAIIEGKAPAEAAEPIIQALAASPDALNAFRDTDASELLAAAVNRRHQQHTIENLDKIARNPSSAENDLQHALDKQWWLFGGRYIDQASRRSLTVLDQMDIPLIRNDGALHIVELKQANIPKLIKKHRNHLVTGGDVHEAVTQAMNYLVSLDEQRAQILADLHVDVRRASATVVLGHTAHVEGFTPQEVRDTLRTYNSHLARIEVITYDELIDGARRSLDFSL